MSDFLKKFGNVNKDNDAAKADQKAAPPKPEVAPQKPEAAPKRRSPEFEAFLKFFNAAKECYKNDLKLDEYWDLFFANEKKITEIKKAINDAKQVRSKLAEIKLKKLEDQLAEAQNKGEEITRNRKALIPVNKKLNKDLAELNWQGQPKLLWLKIKALHPFILCKIYEDFEKTIYGIHQLHPAGFFESLGSSDDPCKVTKMIIDGFTRLNPRELMDISVVNLNTGAGSMEAYTGIDWLCQTPDASGGTGMKTSGTVRLVTKQELSGFIDYLNDVINRKRRFIAANREELNRVAGDNAVINTVHINSIIRNSSDLFKYQVILVIACNHPNELSELVSVMSALGDSVYPVYLGVAEKHDEAWSKFLDSVRARRRK